MLNEILEYIKNQWKICINEKTRIKLNVNIKTIIGKGPKEIYIIDEFKLDGECKNKFGYEWVIKNIEHFSKFLKSYPVVENNSKEILICLKDYWFFLECQKFCRPIMALNIRILL